MHEEQPDTKIGEELPDIKEAEKPPSCLWVKLVFGIIKTLIDDKLDMGTLSNKERKKLAELTNKSVKSLRQDTETIENICGVRYDYIRGATNALNITKDDFPEREDLFCEVLNC